jgi:hypothetical protein
MFVCGSGAAGQRRPATLTRGTYKRPGRAYNLGQIVAESGTVGFASASGRVDFKDIIGATTITYDYRGHIRLA